ncbi:hypothetical protein ACWEFD_18200 [Streptomyces ardesiacus]
MAETTAPPAPVPAPRQPKSIRAEAAFRERLAQLGATLVEPAYLGSKVRHRVRCRDGHDCAPTPNSVAQGNGICRACAGHDPVAAWAAFRTRVEELGGTVLEVSWQGSQTRHRVRCARGHECSPRPGNVAAGQGLCKDCVVRSREALEAAFRVRLEELGASLLEPGWLGISVPHRVRCARGHECQPRPVTALQGIGICRACAGVDPVQAFADFQARLDTMGATLIEPVWRGSNEPHPAICLHGHECAPRPCHVKGGRGICRACVRAYDVLYVVVTPTPGVVKFGITSGDPRPRLGVHARDGLTKVLRLHQELTDGRAVDVERTILGELRAAGERPVRGREYFPAQALPLVLEILDDHLAVTA